MVFSIYANVSYCVLLQSVTSNKLALLIDEAQYSQVSSDSNDHQFEGPLYTILFAAVIKCFIPCHANCSQPCSALPCSALPYSALPCSALPFRALPYYIQRLQQLDRLTPHGACRVEHLQITPPYC